MQDPEGTAHRVSPASTGLRALAAKPPQLLIAWPSARAVFLENLADLLLRRQAPTLAITARPAPFWPDVFVEQRLPWRKLAGSGIYHAIFVLLVYMITLHWVPEGRVRQRNPFDGTTLTYYSVSDFLPAIDTGKRAEPKERQGEPALAKQHILSIPPSHDNVRQTIVTPDPMKIQDDVPLPNLVANSVIPAPPEAMVLQSTARLIAPQITPIAPPPDVNALHAPLLAPPAPQVVGPAVDPSVAKERVNVPNIPGPEVVGPPPSLDAALDRTKLNVPAPSVVGPAVGGDVKRPLGAINMARVNIPVAAPKLPVIEQRTARMVRSGAGSGGRGAAAPAAAPSIASVNGAMKGNRNAGQLLALSIHPAAVRGPVLVPRGSRSGEFEAGPEGKPGAPGTPDIRASKGAGTNGGGNGSSAGPPGIMVSPAPTAVPAGPVVAANPAPAPVQPSPRMFPSMRPMSVADIARSTRRVPPVNADSKPDEVFGTKKYYSMTLNMPSVTSAGGSCIIRFAELNDQHAAGQLTAPIATLKVDPAYPPEEIRDHIEGTVTLYAIIHKDGTVAQVRVLHGIDAILDRNAQVALSHWQFRPATRNGNAVDLEAVVQIPFVAKRKTY